MISPIGSGIRPKPFLLVRVQSVLYRLPKQSVTRALDYLAAAARVASSHGYVRRIVVAYGDCSPERVLDDLDLVDLRRRYASDLDIEYTFFDANLGSAAGHNMLLADASSDMVMIFNPDVLASPRLFLELCDALAEPGVGFAEGRQLPVEHPKDYDRLTGETSWGSTACLMGARALFERLNGFDSETFFLYCDDVDLSWRARLLGKKIVHCSDAVVYHDKRLSPDGGWMSSDAERYYSAEAALMLSHKFSRPDLTENNLAYFRICSDGHLQQAARTFELKRLAGKLPQPVDADHAVGQFIDGNYALHRFSAR